MGTEYHTVHSGGDFCADNKRMYIRVYPNTDYIHDNYLSDPQTDVYMGLKDACEQLLNGGQINYYTINRFHAKDYNYPCVNIGGSTAKDTKKYLTGNTDTACSPLPNGTGEDLYSLRGAHLLVHGDDCLKQTAGGESGDTCDSSGGKSSAFDQGRVVFTPASCAKNARTRASAAQEVLHQFIMAKHPDVKSLLYDGDDDGSVDNDEHSLGRVNSNQNATPLLVYHASEFEKDETCNGSAYDLPISYTTTLTGCTKKAIDAIASDPDCNDQPLDRIC